MLVKRIVFASREHFLEDYLKDFPTGGLFVAGDEPWELGDAIVLEVVFPEIPEGIFISGRTVWRRMTTRWKSALPAGVGVQFDASETVKRDFLIDFVHGTLTATRKRARRIPARLRVDYAQIGVAREMARAETRDIGRGGLFLHTDTLARYGSSLDMVLFPPNPLPPARATGRVAWIGHMQGQSGMGVQFLFRSRDARVQIDRIVSGLEDQLARGAVPVHVS